MILTVGDSICWGQGLKEEHKFDFLVAASQGTPFQRTAHSGAVIGTSRDTSAGIEPGEIPVASPSVWQQVLAARDWSQVELVLLNGGINDVGVSRILSPWTSASQLALWVDQFCDKAIQELLEVTAGKLTAPGARIAVIGYYPILSTQSGLTLIQFQSLLEIHGVATHSVIASDQFSLIDLVPLVVGNCLTFWQKSNVALQAAVDAVNARLGRSVCVFVRLPFAEENALWAPRSLLWELTPLLLPQDEVSDPRGKVCQTLYGDVAHIPQWVQCVRVSVGHPRVEGAARIAAAVMAAL